MRRLLWPVVLALAIGPLALAPSSRPGQAVHECENWPGAFDIDAYEAQASGTLGWNNVYARSMEFAAFNQLAPDIPSFRLPQLETGPRSDGSSNLIDPYIPPVIVKASGWIESGWTQACPSIPYGSVGPVLVSHDFGYGIMQITSGMGGGTTAVPTLDQVMIGGHYGFNIARGAQILLDKWNAAPTFRPIVGDRLPGRVENWYYAIWSYNGFSFKNHPLNPNLPFPRAPYLCDGTQSRSNYPYQELVLGCLANPPVVEGSQLWSPVSVTLPNLSQQAFSLTNWDACRGSFDCAGMDIPTPTPSHADPTGVSGSRSAAIGSPVLSVNPLDIIFTAPPGGQSAAVTVTIANSGTGPLAWRSSPGITWVDLSAGSGIALGTDLGSQTSTLTLSASSAGLGLGIYSGVIRISSLYPQTTQTISVTLIIAQSGFIPGVARD